MRGIAYAIAAIAAVGIMIAIATIPKQTGPIQAGTDNSATGAAASAVSISPNVMAEAGTLTISVPTMHCEFACYPTVKATLEKAEGVQQVELAEQKDAGVIDNRQVIVKYDAGFDVSAALTSLAKEGFTESEVVQ